MKSLLVIHKLLIEDPKSSNGLSIEFDLQNGDHCYSKFSIKSSSYLAQSFCNAMVICRSNL